MYQFHAKSFFRIPSWASNGEIEQENISSLFRLHASYFLIMEVENNSADISVIMITFYSQNVPSCEKRRMV